MVAKSVLVILLALALLFPEQSHLRDKAAGLRAIGYPIASFLVPVPVVERSGATGSPSPGCRTC